MVKFDSKSFKKVVEKDAIRLIVVLLAAFLMSVNINSFVNAVGLYPGGATGIAIIIQRIALKYWNLYIAYTPITVLLNAIPVYIGFKYIGRKFTLFSLIMVVSNGFFVDLLPDYAVTQDPLLAAVFGGILNAIAITMCLKVDATSGGTDFISIFLSQKKGVDAFPYILGANIVILGIAGIIFGLDKALYSMIFQYVTTTALHTLYRTYQQRTLFIITDMPDRVCSMIYSVCGHGATLIDGEGSFAHKNKKIVYSIVSASDTRKIIPRIREIDPNAFINSIRTEEIMGNFYMRPRD
ncbi:MAG: YitT family protein [Butyrivibrio sp.]|nr:YitT family protein [Butyrivibrio sp.]